MLSTRQSLKILTKISPQQIQFIKLLQIPTANLEARVKEELEANPALSEGDMEQDQEERKDEYAEADGEDSQDNEEDFNLDDYMDREGPGLNERLPSYNGDDDEYEAPIVHLQSFMDQLNEQLGMLHLTETEEIIADHLVGSIEEDGYLRRPVPAVVHDMAFRYNLRATAEEVESVLRKIQEFEPAGVGARDLRECLILQLERKEPTVNIEYALKILRDYYEEFSKKHFKKLKSALSISEEELSEVYAEITKLNPKPGSSPSNIKHTYIIPDFTLKVENNDISVQLHGRNAPDLRVSNSYIRMYDDYKAQQKAKKKDVTVKETLDFVKQKIESAQWFIDAIRQRQFTLLNTMMAIAEMQKEFFLSGGDEKKLRPMILKDIADVVKMDISTISRVANSKHVQTDWQIYPLKYFFTEGITMESGEEVSNREVKSILAELIEAEAKRKPLSDDKLSALLKEKGYNIARRTVAKYREQLNIPIARLRKEV